jgi:hypothetical protein
MRDRREGYANGKREETRMGDERILGICGDDVAKGLLLLLGAPSSLAHLLRQTVFCGWTGAMALNSAPLIYIVALASCQLHPHIRSCMQRELQKATFVI